MEICASLERWVLKNLGIDVSGGQADLWKEATAYVLRNRPNISLERALAESFAEIYCADVGDVQKILENPCSFDVPGKLYTFSWISGRAYVGTDSGLYVWKGRDWIKLPVFSVRVTSIAKIGRKIYAGTSKGLYVKDARRWVRRRKAGPWIDRIVHTGGHVYVISFGGMYFQSGRRWIKLCNNPWIWAIAEKDSNVFIGTTQGLYVRRLKARRWSRIHKFRDGVRFITEAAGQIYIITFGDALFVLNKGQWTEVHERGVSIVNEAGSRVYVGTDHGLYLWDGEHCVPVPEVSGQVHCITRSSGKLYVGTDSGLYIYDNAWTSHVNVGSIYQIFAAGKKGVFLNTSEGFWLLRSEIENLPSNWKDALLAEIWQHIERSQSETESNVNRNPFQLDSKGLITKKDGRVIFS